MWQGATGRKKGARCKECLVGEGDAEPEVIHIGVSTVSTVWGVSIGTRDRKCIVSHIILQNKKEAEE